MGFWEILSPRQQLKKLFNSYLSYSNIRIDPKLAATL